MKTAQIMKRKFLDGEISQNHQTKWFCATDLIRIGNNYRKSTGLNAVYLDDYLSSNQSQEFIIEVLDKYKLSKAIDRKGKGRGAVSWVHPLIFIDLAMWINPKFKIEILEWVSDFLCHYRDSSGDSYKQFSRVVFNYAKLNGKSADLIRIMASKIREKLNYDDDWNNASEILLKKRDLVHKNVVMLLKAGVNLDRAIAVAVEEI